MDLRQGVGGERIYHHHECSISNASMCFCHNELSVVERICMVRGSGYGLWYWCHEEAICGATQSLNHCYHRYGQHFWSH